MAQTASWFGGLYRLVQDDVALGVAGARAEVPDILACLFVVRLCNNVAAGLSKSIIT